MDDPPLGAYWGEKIMGLTIHYSFRARGTLQDETVHRIVQRTARLAKEIGCPHVGKVLLASDDDRTAPEFFDSAGRTPRRMFGGPGKWGWLVEVWPGEGSEPAMFGLIRHRPRIPGEFSRTRRPRWNSRWELDAWCKTYYAAEHGLEHFVQCHERVVQLLDLWRRAEVQVRVRDDGGYWKTRSRAQLAAQIGDHELFLKSGLQRLCT